MSECLTCDPLHELHDPLLSWPQPPYLSHLIRNEIDYLPERTFGLIRSRDEWLLQLVRIARNVDRCDNTAFLSVCLSVRYVLVFCPER